MYIVQTALTHTTQLLESNEKMEEEGTLRKLTQYLDVHMTS